MLRGDNVRAGVRGWLLAGSQPLLLVGFVAEFLALGVLPWSTGVIVVPVTLILAGVLAAGGAVTVRPQSPVVVASAAGVAVLASVGMSNLADSAQLVLVVLAFIGFFAAFLLALPQGIGWALVKRCKSQGKGSKGLEDARARGQLIGTGISRAVVSLLLVVHFAGILSCVLTVPVGTEEPSWLWVKVRSGVRPYLQFAYLSNAYHFYSPNPGPPTLIWFQVEYADGSKRWLKLPNREEHTKDPVAQEFIRWLQIGNSIQETLPLPSIPEDVMQARIAAGKQFRSPELPEGIPLFNQGHPDTPLVNNQYQLATETTKRNLTEYARYLARNLPSEKDADSEVVGIKIYRVVHKLMSPWQMGDPLLKPTDPWTYDVFYQGEYTKDGVLKNPNDPFLWWLIPIYRMPMDAPENLPSRADLSTVVLRAPLENLVVRNCLEVHARGPRKEKKGQE